MLYCVYVRLRGGERCEDKEGDLRFGGGWLGGPVVYCSY